MIKCFWLLVSILLLLPVGPAVAEDGVAIVEFIVRHNARAQQAREVNGAFAQFTEDAVAQGLAGNVLRLRQRFVEGGGANDAVMILLPLSISSTIPLLRGLQRVLNWPVLSQSDAVIKDIADRLQLDLQGFQDVLLLKRGQITPGPSEIPRLFDRYLQASTALAKAAMQAVQQ